jgi:hypothetical protein
LEPGLNITHKLVKIGEKALENPEEIIKEKRVKCQCYKTTTALIYCYFRLYYYGNFIAIYPGMVVKYTGILTLKK